MKKKKADTSTSNSKMFSLHLMSDKLGRNDVGIGVSDESPVLDIGKINNNNHTSLK